MRNLKLVIWSIFALYWQILIAPKFTISGIQPDFLIPYVIFISLRFDFNFTLPITFILGLSLDLLHPATLGLHTISLLLISFFVHNFHQPINKKRLIVVFLAIFILNFFHYLLFFLFQFISSSLTSGLPLSYFYWLIYNSLLSFITVYFLLLIDKLKITIDA
jgi:rod shape-determining protein MreD